MELWEKAKSKKPKRFVVIAIVAVVVMVIAFGSLAAVSSATGPNGIYIVREEWKIEFRPSAIIPGSGQYISYLLGGNSNPVAYHLQGNTITVDQSFGANGKWTFYYIDGFVLRTISAKLAQTGEGVFEYKLNETDFYNYTFGADGSVVVKFQDAQNGPNDEVNIVSGKYYKNGKLYIIKWGELRPPGLDDTTYYYEYNGTLQFATIREDSPDALVSP
jgi:hypothetical protein